MTTTYPLQNGSSTPILGRGILRCHPERRLELAAAAVLAQRPFVPSIAQAVQDFHVSRRELVERIEAYRALEGNGNGNGGQAAAAATDTAAAEGMSVKVVRGSEYVQFLVEALQQATPEERLEAARMLGLGWCWDHLIAPNVKSNGND
jgi:hypothetical protein